MCFIYYFFLLIGALFTSCKGDESALNARVDFTKKQYHTGDTVVALLTIKNDSMDTVILFPTINQLKYRRATKTIIEFNTEKKEYIPNSTVDIGEGDPYTTLAPSEQTTDTLFFIGMHLNGDKYIINPLILKGKYRIMVILHFWKYFPEYPPNQFVGDIKTPWSSIEIK